MFGRRRNRPSVIAALLGPFFGLGAVLLILWNEHHALRTANSLAEGAAQVIEAKASPLDPSLEGRLVHLTGEATSEEPLRDAPFGFQTRGLRLTRVVEICESTQENRSLEPSNSTRNPDGFRATWRDLSTAAAPPPPRGTSNPGRPPAGTVAVAYPPTVQLAASVRVGAYELDRNLLSQVTDDAPLTLTADDVRLPPGAHLLPSGQIFVGQDPATPRVGDLRITEKMAPLGPVSVVAAQRGERLAPYLAQAGGEVGLVERGTLSAPEMLAAAQTTNRVLTWVLRVLGFIGLTLGVRGVISPFSQLASVVPVLGAVFNGGIMLVSVLVSVVVWSLLVSTAWMTARPLVGLGLIAAIGVGGLLLVRTLKKPAAR